MCIRDRALLVDDEAMLRRRHAPQDVSDHLRAAEVEALKAELNKLNERVQTQEESQHALQVANQSLRHALEEAQLENASLRSVEDKSHEDGPQAV